MPTVSSAVARIATFGCASPTRPCSRRSPQPLTVRTVSGDDGGCTRQACRRAHRHFPLRYAGTLRRVVAAKAEAECGREALIQTLGQRGSADTSRFSRSSGHQSRQVSRRSIRFARLEIERIAPFQPACPSPTSVAMRPRVAARSSMVRRVVGDDEGGCCGRELFKGRPLAASACPPTSRGRSSTSVRIPGRIAGRGAFRRPPTGQGSCRSSTVREAGARTDKARLASACELPHSLAIRPRVAARLG
jgi:hypothetical protein